MGVIKDIDKNRKTRKAVKEGIAGSIRELQRSGLDDGINVKDPKAELEGLVTEASKMAGGPEQQRESQLAATKGYRKDGKSPAKRAKVATTDNTLTGAHGEPRQEQ